MEPLRSAETPLLHYREAERDAIRQQLERLVQVLVLQTVQVQSH